MSAAAATAAVTADTPAGPGSAAAALLLLEEAARAFAAAPPALWAARDLLRRVDTKYVCDVATASRILAGVRGAYAALPVSTGHVATYRSLYFDTPDLRCYHDHRCGRRIRHKVRIRHYPERELSYLEIKTKRNEVVTEKLRLPIAFRREQLGLIEQTFLRQHLQRLGPATDALEPRMRVDFRRLSLLGLDSAERVTIDVAIDAERLDGGARLALGGLAVVEVKQAPFCVRTPIMRAIAAAHLREQSLSKYTIATALLRPELRKNRLLPDVRAIERMTS